MAQTPDPDSQADVIAGVLDSSLVGNCAHRSVRDEHGRIVDFTITLVNRKAEELLGRTANELLGRGLLEVLPGNKPEGLFDAYVKVVETGEPFTAEHYYEHDGLAGWFRINASRCGDGFTVSFADITHDKCTNEQFRIIFEHSTNAHLVFDGTRILDCNQAAVEMLGYSNKLELLNASPADLSPAFQPDGKPSSEKSLEIVRATREQGPQRFNWVHRRKDGSDITIEVRLSPIKLAGKDAMLVAWHDLTERLESERKLRDAAARLSEAQALANLGSWEWTTADNQIHWSDQIKRMFELPLDQPAPSFEEHRKQIHPEDVGYWESVLDKAAKDHRPYTMRFRTLLPSGRCRVLESRGHCEVNADGELVRTFGTVQDITEQQSAERRIKAVNERFELMVAGSANGIWDWDCTNDTVYYSPRFEEILGYAAGGMAPTLEAFISHLHPEDLDRIKASMQAHLHAQAPYDVEYRVRHKEGHYVWCHAAGQAQWGPGGAPVRMAGSITDISGRKEKEIEIRKLSLLASKTDNGAIITDPTGRVDWVNQAFTEMTGYTLEEMVGRRPGELLQGPDTDPDTVARMSRALQKKEGFRETVLNYTKQGRSYWVEIEVQPIQDERGELVYFMAIERDVSEQIAHEKELIKARDMAEQASASKSSFVANMSHEIRTPMNAILGYADLLLDGDQSEADKRNHAQTIRRNGQHLMGILNDVLDFSKIEAGRMSVESINCAPDQLFADVITLMMPQAMGKGIELDFQTHGPLPPRVQTDPTRVRQVLLNLIGNAIKFTKDGRVTLGVTSRPASDGRIELACDVTDTGIGIDPEKLGQLFKPFSQADESTTRQFGGTGLGLAISHNLCALLGGELTCTSEPGAGSTFSARFLVGLPVAEEAAGAKTHRTGPCGGDVIAGRRVLVVEDGKDNQRLIGHYLDKAGAKVEMAENGAIGRDLTLAAQAAGEAFDMVLMDMQMPVLDGYGATRQLREAGYHRPVIALTAHASAQDRQACLDAGCTDYLSKPIDRHKLIATIARHLGAQVEHGAGV